MNGGFETIWDGIESASSSAGVFSCGACFLAFVFLFSAVPKLRRPELAAMAIADFGIGRRGHVWAGRALGMFELLLALSLIGASAASDFVARAVPVGVAALLLSLFAALIANAMRLSQRFACYCFGADDSPLSALTLLRTAFLATAASFLLIVANNVSSQGRPQDWLLAVVVGSATLGVLLLLSGMNALWRVRT